MDNSAFISYRRNISAFIARAVFQDLRANGINAFMDIESIDSGQFDTIILNQIAARPYFLVILTPGTLERCQQPGDWLLREMEFALKLERKIIPILTPNFDFGDVGKYLKGQLAKELPRFNAVNVPYDYFEAAMDRLRTRFLKPVNLPVAPTPEADEPVVQQKVAHVIAEAPVTEKQLGAQDYFERALARATSELDDRITDYTEAIRLDPHYADAYYNRGNARRNKGNPDGAIADYTEAIRLNPQYADAYTGRGLARYERGDREGAIADYTESIRLNPRYVEAYLNRGLVRNAIGNPDGAITDYTEAIRLNPQYADAYFNRGLVYKAKRDYKRAMIDFQKVLQIKPNHPRSLAMQIDIERWQKLV